MCSVLMNLKLIIARFSHHVVKDIWSVYLQLAWLESVERGMRRWRILCHLTQLYKETRITRYLIAFGYQLGGVFGWRETISYSTGSWSI